MVNLTLHSQHFTLKENKSEPFLNSPHQIQTEPASHWYMQWYINRLHFGRMVSRVHIELPAITLVASCIEFIFDLPTRPVYHFTSVPHSIFIYKIVIYALSPYVSKWGSHHVPCFYTASKSSGHEHLSSWTLRDAQVFPATVSSEPSLSCIPTYMQYMCAVWLMRNGSSTLADLWQCVQ